jgi:hypothetical protein
MYATKSHDQIMADAHVRSSDEHKTHVVRDQMAEAWSAHLLPRLYRLREIQAKTSQPIVAHLILDNAGTELLMDLCLADWLVARGLCDSVVLHAKSYPWFVSDVVEYDIWWLIEELNKCPLSSAQLSNEELSTLQWASVTWRSRLETKQWTIRAHPFWTTALPFSHLPEVAGDLYSFLCGQQVTALHEESHLPLMWIFKGDLNYRKLVYDCAWPDYTIPFEEALGALGASTKQWPTSQPQPPLIALRTCKSDVIVGVESRDKLEEIDCAGGSDWLINGKWAVAQVSAAKS